MTLKKLLIYSLLFICATLNAQNGTDTIEDNTQEVNGLTVAAFNERVNKSKQPVMVYFKADWCIVCRKQRPVLKEVVNEKKGKVEFLEIDMEKNPLIAAHFEVDGLPIIILYKNGKIVWDKMGLTQKQELLDQIKFFE
jgi:thioredoxin 1